MIDFGEDQNNNGILELSESDFDACLTDDTYKFATDGTGILNNGALSCNPGPVTEPIRWQFTDSETKLSLSFPGSGPFFENATIIQLDNSNLIVSESVPSPIFLVIFKR